MLRDVDANLVERITEAQERVWLGEIKGLQDILKALREKTGRLERLAAVGVTDSTESMA